MFSRVLIAVILASFTSVSAWWGTGHMMIARIAYDKLMSESPEVIDRSNGILSHLADFTTME